MLLVELLRPSRGTGFPTDYLLARLPSRRADRLSSCPARGGMDARRELDLELDWFHEQLAPELRKKLAPALLFFELPGLLAALRYREAGDRQGIRNSLESSRLHRTIRSILTEDRPWPETMKELGEKLAPLDRSLAGLELIRRDRGRTGFEQAIGAGLLAAGRREHHWGPVRDFLDQLAARQALLRRAKAERWPGKISHPPQIRQLRGLRQLQYHSQPGNDCDPAALDQRLLTMITRHWQRRSRTTGRLEQLLDYLWTCYLIARDCGIRQLTELLGEERVAEEVIL